MLAVDLFAGAGGWSEACRELGVYEIGFETWPAANATALAAGHVRREGDVLTADPLHPTWRDAEIFLGSPPCQSFANSGHKDGLRQMDILVEAISGMDVVAHRLQGGARLMLEPLRWMLARMDVERPFEAICMEQVTNVEPAWVAYQDLLRSWGYSVRVHSLDAAMFGLAQSRTRCILWASRERTVGFPEYEKTVGFAEALGLEGDWSFVSNNNHGSTGRRGVRHSPEPAFTLTGKCVPQNKLVEGHIARPKSTTGLGRGLTASEAGILQGFRPDYPWRGRQDEQGLQIGNAFPPTMAKKILECVL